MKHPHETPTPAALFAAECMGPEWSHPGALGLTVAECMAAVRAGLALCSGIATGLVFRAV